MRTKVYEYIKKPLLCGKCLDYGHSKKVCQGTTKCKNCAADKIHENCTNDKRCYHCSLNHEAGNKIRELMERNHSKQTAHTDHTLGHECTELKQGGDLMVNFINVQDRFTPVRNKTVDFQPLETIVDKNKFRGSNFCLTVMGYVTWIAHHWRDKVYLKKNTTCNHQYLCPCKKKLLADRQIDRPF